MTSSSPADAETAATAELLGIVQLARQACRAYGRDDLGDRVDHLAELVDRHQVQVVVVGEFKQGKSSLVNALIGADVCPVDADIATAAPTAISHGRPAVHVVTRPIDDPDAEPRRRPIELSEVRRYATEAAADPAIRVEGVEIQLERELLRTGLVLVDTPGVGGLGSAHATAALGALALADAAMFVTDASQELTRTEIDFLRRAHELCGHIIGVMTKVDFYPAWRKVADLNRQHLIEAGLDVTFVAVSSSLRHAALAQGDRELNAESGYPELVRMLLDDVVSASRRRTGERIGHDLLSVCDQLRSQFQAVVEATTDPDRARATVARLEDARTRSEHLKSRSARWSTTLNDGFADLASDIDHDFRERIRRVMSDADDAIAESDPAEVWTEFEPWLVERVSYEVVANYRYLSDRADVLSAEVAEHFDVDGDELRAALDVHTPTEVLAQFDGAPDVDTSTMSFAGQSMSVLRGSYMGVLMFTMLGSMVGLSLGPVAIGIGLLMGRKSLRDEKERQLQKRRVEARNSIRRYCDDVSFQVSKDGRDTLRRVQRQLRDHYTVRAEELHRSTSEALAAANDAMKSDRSEADSRRRDAEAELARIGGLRERVVVFTEGAGER